MHFYRIYARAFLLEARAQAKAPLPVALGGNALDTRAAKRR